MRSNNAERIPASALGHKRTFAPQKVMSALLPKADMTEARKMTCESTF